MTDRERIKWIAELLAGYAFTQAKVWGQNPIHEGQWIRAKETWKEFRERSARPHPSIDDGLCVFLDPIFEDLGAMPIFHRALAIELARLLRQVELV